MMSKFTKLLRHRLRHSRAGQSIILLALGMIGLLAFVGLVTDVSLLFVRFSQLRRAVDAASIAAAGQVRENRDYADVALTARQFIRLHGLDPEGLASALVFAVSPGATVNSAWLEDACGRTVEAVRRIVRWVSEP